MPPTTIRRFWQTPLRMPDVWTNHPRHCRHAHHDPDCWALKLLLRPPPELPTPDLLSVAERRGREQAVICLALAEGHSGIGSPFNPFRFAHPDLAAAWHEGLRQVVDGSTVAGLLPGYVAVFDMADTKRRNCYLGLDRVDEDIAAFLPLLRETLPEGEALAARTKGNEWVAILRKEHLPYLTNVIEAYRSRTPLRLGWTCQARSLDGEERVIQREAEVVIERAFRCGVRRLDRAGDLAGSVEEIRRHVGLLPVNEVVGLSGDSPMPPARKWQCVRKYRTRGNAHFAGPSFLWIGRCREMRRVRAAVPIWKCGCSDSPTK